MARTPVFAISVGAMLGAWLADADAQVLREPLGPLQCFEIADTEGLASTMAIELCAGAISAAPGQCLAIAEDQDVLSTLQIVDLCANATSIEPVACFGRLQADWDLTNEQMIEYCGTRCPLGPAPPEVTNASCLIAATENTNLTYTMAEQLCLRAQSTAPVECFVAGEDATELTYDQLVDLCAETRSCQYVNVPPSP